MINLIFFFILISLFFLIIFQRHSIIIKYLGFLSSGGLFFLSLLTTFYFDLNITKFQFKTQYSSVLLESFFNFKLSFGVDHLSLLFFILTTFLIFLCVLFVITEAKQHQIYFYIFNLILLEFFLILIFLSLDILIFYAAFEAVLIPMFFLTGIFGTRERKVWALYLLFFYTILGSLFMLLGILYLYCLFGTFDIELFFSQYILNESAQKFIWLSFVLSFLSKIPVFPLHIWLPEAHVEAPTVGSVILAGILLKLGVYGLVRFNLSLWPLPNFIFTPYILLFCMLGVLVASLSAIGQTDIKRIIAYSSVAHMNLVVIGLFCGPLGLCGGLFQSLSHGLVASGLFFLIGFLYSRYHSRGVQYYQGLVQILPLYSTFFILFSLANIALPGTSAFIGELFIFLQTLNFNIFFTFTIISSIVLGAVYSLWLSNRILFGNLGNSLTAAHDLKLSEFIILFSLVFFIFIYGIFPSILMNYLNILIFAHTHCYTQFFF
jgi:proton-translocating NADH-quinone oxidoreductase chain M